MSRAKSPKQFCRSIGFDIVEDILKAEHRQIDIIDAVGSQKILDRREQL
jgi:hypothetical protein